MHSKQVEEKKQVLGSVATVDDMYDMLAAYEQKVGGSRVAAARGLLGYTGLVHLGPRPRCLRLLLTRSSTCLLAQTPTADQVKHDDLREASNQFVVELQVGTHSWPPHEAPKTLGCPTSLSASLPAFSWPKRS